MKRLLSVALCLSVIVHVTQAAVWRVNNQGFSADYTDLQLAINDVDDVPDFDTLHVEPSAIAYGNITLNRPLVLIGPGYLLAENVLPSPLQADPRTATIASVYLGASAAGRKLAGLTINALAFAGGGVIVERCRLGLINMEGNSPGIQPFNDVTVTRSYVDGYWGWSQFAPAVNGISVTNCYFGGTFILAPYHQGVISQCVFNYGVSIHGMTFFNNIVRGGLTLSNNINSTVNMYNNIFHDNPGAWLDGGTNHRNELVSSFFPVVGSTDAKLIPLGSCSICSDGVNGEQIGMFGGSTPYILSGIPAIPTIYVLTAPSTAIQGETIGVTIGTKINN